MDAKGISKKLEASGVQPTAQRIAIFQYVLCEADHPTAEQVKAWADHNFPKLSLATVYNTLKVLVEAKLLKEFKLPHSSKVVYDCNVGKHYHFLDEDTGRLFDIDPELIKLKSRLKKDFQVNDVHILLQGRKRVKKS